jgi:hypothetical protein
MNPFPRPNSSIVLQAACLACAALLVLLLTACESMAVATAGETTPVFGVSELLQLDATKRQTLEGKTIRLLGRYAGYKGHCPGPPPLSRSDWMLDDESLTNSKTADDGKSCLYISGPVREAEKSGNPLTIEGQLADKDGQFYLLRPRP